MAGQNCQIRVVVDGKYIKSRGLLKDAKDGLKEDNKVGVLSSAGFISCWLLGLNQFNNAHLE